MLFDRFSAKSRLRKLEVFYDAIKPKSDDRVLDVGGETDPEGGSVQLCDHYPWKRQLTVTNIDLQATKRVRQTHAECAGVLGDACKLPFADQSFDIGFSNAVIEHLYDWNSQLRMASEIRRVCKRWFITTPNRWYPYEFHARLPLISWLPARWMRKITRIVCYNHAKGRYMGGLQTDSIRLLTQSEMQKLFPDSRIVSLRLTVYPETLLAIGPTPALA